MEIKKISVLNPYVATLGGGEKHMGYLLQFLEKRYQKAQIDILVHNYNEINIYDPAYMNIEDLNKKFNLHLERTKLRKIDLDTSGTLISKVMNKRKIENITKDYDLFINNMFLSKHIGKAKYNIYEVMFPPQKYSVENRPDMPRFVAQYYDRKFIDSYQMYISISQFTNHWLNVFWGDLSGKYSIIYPPVFTEQETKGRYQEKEKENIIISVGRFFTAEHCKRQLDMVQFFVNHYEDFKDYQYHLAGSVSNLPADIEYYEKVCEIAGKVDNVIIHKDCPYQELMDLYKKAKIFWHATGYSIDENVNPEKTEHFGITTVEAMSFGAVPVVINKGGQKETVVHGENGFLWNTEEECVKHTLRLIRDDELRKRFAEVSSQRANLYSIDEFYRQNRRLFDECGL